MLTTPRFLASVLALLMFATAAPAAAAPKFERGINLLKPFNLASRTREGRYADPPFNSPAAKISDGEMQRFKALGFDHVRVTIDPGVFIEAADERRAQFEAGLEKFVRRLQAAGLNVLLDPHPMPGKQAWAPDQILTDLNGVKFLRYRAFLLDLARLAGQFDSTRIALGLMNEPQRDCVRKEGPDWVVFQKALFDSVRAEAPDLTLVLTTGCWSSLRALPSLDMSEYDANTLVDLHFYDPYVFTHQSPGFAAAPFRFIAGVSYPASEGSVVRTLEVSRAWQTHLRESGYPGKIDEAGAAKTIADYYLRQRPDAATIRSSFDKIAEWALTNGVEPARIVISEFGAWRLQPPVADDGSRARWIADVRKTAEAKGFGWTYWEYMSPFGLVTDDKSRAIDRSVADALGLNAGADDPGVQSN